MFVTDQTSLGKKGYLSIPLYNKLEPLNGPIVYFYKFKKRSQQEVHDAFKAFKNSKTRNCSALRKRSSPRTTNTLYVGSDRNSLARRTMEHMGYAHQHTGGLQLSKWAPEISLELELYFAQVEPKFLPVLRQIETALAHALDPLIGSKDD
jgi:hypothetical protein